MARYQKELRFWRPTGTSEDVPKINQVLLLIYMGLNITAFVFTTFIIQS